MSFVSEDFCHLPVSRTHAHIYYITHTRVLYSLDFKFMLIVILFKINVLRPWIIISRSYISLQSPPIVQVWPYALVMIIIEFWIIFYIVFTCYIYIFLPTRIAERRISFNNQYLYAIFFFFYIYACANHRDLSIILVCTVHSLSRV